MVYGVDVSDWQGPINWHLVRQEASPTISFAYGKATDGSNNEQEYFNDYHDGAREAGLDFGAYHFFRFEDDAGAQANNFLNATLGTGRGGTLIPMVDVEVGAASPSPLASFLAVIQQAFKIPAMLVYTDAGWWDSSGLGDGFAGHPLWIANFVHEENMPKGSPYMPQTGGWKKWTVWQYDNEGAILGIGNVDLDQVARLDSIRRPGL